MIDLGRIVLIPLQLEQFQNKTGFHTEHVNTYPFLSRFFSAV